MNTADYVDQLVIQLKNEGIPLSDAAWEVALSCVDWPYVFGAWGEYCTPEKRKRRASDAHPTIVSKCQVLSGKKSSCSGCKWLPDGKNVRMYDCRGFTDWVLKQFGIDLTGEGATSQWNNKANWETKGTIDTIPDDILVCVFVHNSSTGKMEHTGLAYHGATCECSNGVQYFAKRKSKWSHWAMPKGIGGEVPVPTPSTNKPTLRKGDKGPYVTLAQTELLQKGYALPRYGADGSFGNETLAAVKQLQYDFGLTVDGIIGPRTWEVLDSTIHPTLYTVTIPHLVKDDAEKLIKQYPDGKMTEEG